MFYIARTDDYKTSSEDPIGLSEWNTFAGTRTELIPGDDSLGFPRYFTLKNPQGAEVGRVQWFDGRVELDCDIEPAVPIFYASRLNAHCFGSMGERFENDGSSNLSELRAEAERRRNSLGGKLYRAVTGD